MLKAGAAILESGAAILESGAHRAPQPGPAHPIITARASHNNPTRLFSEGVPFGVRNGRTWGAAGGGGAPR